MFLIILSHIHPLYSVLIEIFASKSDFFAYGGACWDSALCDVFLTKCRVCGNVIGHAIEIDRIAETSIMKHCQ